MVGIEGDWDYEFDEDTGEFVDPEEINKEYIDSNIDTSDDDKPSKLDNMINDLRGKPGSGVFICPEEEDPLH